MRCASVQRKRSARSSSGRARRSSCCSSRRSRATAYVLGADFNRVQFTPDTTPTELVGQNITRAGETKFIKGTIFTNVLLADEVNRTPPRTQSALLEAMAERAVTIEG